MLTVQRFIDSIADLSADNRAVLQKHVQSREFGTSLDADCDELFKEALQKDLPATFNALDRTAVRRALKHPGPSDLQAKIAYMYHVTKRQEAQDQTAKAASSSATAPKRKRVESVCGVQIVPCLPPVFEQSKRQRIQQQLSQYPSASINKFAWTGDEDTPEELERLRLRLQALTGWDDFPSNLEFRTQMLFDVHIKDESNRVEITGKPHIVLQHTNVEPGGFMLEDTLLLIEAMKDLSPEALETAEAKPYMKYVAFQSATHRHVPMLLTDGNSMILYVYDTRLNVHQRMHWDFSQIWDASIYLEKLVKEIALNKSLMRGYIPGRDDQPESPGDSRTEHRGPTTDHAEPSTDHDEREHDDKDTRMTNADRKHSMPGTARFTSVCLRHCLTEMQAADMQEALQLARFHPCVTAVYGCPLYARPNDYRLAF